MTNNTTIITGTAPEIVFEPETDQGKLCMPKWPKPAQGRVWILLIHVLELIILTIATVGPKYIHYDTTGGRYGYYTARKRPRDDFTAVMATIRPLNGSATW